MKYIGLPCRQESHLVNIVCQKWPLECASSNLNYLKESEALRESDKIIVTFSQNRFTPAVQKCVYELLEHNVSQEHIGSVMKACFQCAGVTADRFPSRPTVNNINIQRLSLAQAQLKESLPSKQHLTVESDETTKYYHKLMTQSLRDEEGQPHLLGLREIPSKSAIDTLDVFKEALSDLDTLAMSGNVSPVSAEIIYRIKNTMSDRAATEEKFYDILEEFRSGVLPKVVDNWDNLDSNVKAGITRLNNFWCGLHTLVHAAESVNATCIEVENAIFDGKPPISDSTFHKVLKHECQILSMVC